MMQATVCKIFDFPASHQNVHHPGHCSRIHGHTWTLEVYAKGRINTDESIADYGMVVDFSTIKQAYREMVEPYVEHQHLNETLKEDLEEFTTELFAGWILKELKKMVPCVFKVRLWEGKTSFAEVCEGDLLK